MNINDFMDKYTARIIVNTEMYEYRIMKSDYSWNAVRYKKGKKSTTTELVGVRPELENILAMVCKLMDNESEE